MGHDEAKVLGSPGVLHVLGQIHDGRLATIEDVVAFLQRLQAPLARLGELDEQLLDLVQGTLGLLCHHIGVLASESADALLEPCAHQRLDGAVDRGGEVADGVGAQGPERRQHHVDEVLVQHEGRASSLVEPLEALMGARLVLARHVPHLEQLVALLEQQIAATHVLDARVKHLRRHDSARLGVEPTQRTASLAAHGTEALEERGRLAVGVAEGFERLVLRQAKAAHLLRVALGCAVQRLKVVEVDIEVLQEALDVQAVLANRHRSALHPLRDLFRPASPHVSPHAKPGFLGSGLIELTLLDRFAEVIHLDNLEALHRAAKGNTQEMSRLVLTQDQALEAFGNAYRQSSALFKGFGAMRRETGRALRRFHTKASRIMTPEMLDASIKDMGGRDLLLEQGVKLFEMRNMAGKNNMAAIRRLERFDKRARATFMLNEYFVNMVLSAFRTLSTNTIGNFATTVYGPIEALMGARLKQGIGTLRGENTDVMAEQAKRALDEIQQLFVQFTEAGKWSLKALKKGDYILDGGQSAVMDLPKHMKDAWGAENLGFIMAH